MFAVLFSLSIVLIPSAAEAWGPLTHVYLANQVLDLGVALVPAGIYGLLKQYKSDFLYGNLSADIILGRRFQKLKKNSHDWNTAWKLFASARDDSQTAFAYGYLTHLCADTVVHNLEKGSMPFRHSFLEVKSESTVDRKYRKMIKSLDKVLQKKNDVFLEDTLESVFFSFKTNKKIFKSFLRLSGLPTYAPLSNFLDKRFPHEIPVVDINRFKQESLNRMLEVLTHGKRSDVLKNHPLGRHRRKAS